MRTPSVALADLRSAVRAGWRDPLVYGEVTQTVKTAAAVVLAWLAASHLLAGSQAFLAPWSALFTVHATVYRSLSRGLRQVGASVVGLLVAFLLAALFGFTWVTLAIATLVCLVLGRHRRLGSEGLTVAATALVVMTTGYSDDTSSLSMRLMETAIGIAVGVLVNLLVWPPLTDRGAARQVNALDLRFAELLHDIANEMWPGYDSETAGRWIARTRDLDAAIDRAWRQVQLADESKRFNFRPGRRLMNQEPGYTELLHRLEQAVAESRSMARTLQRHAVASAGWSPQFRDPWLNMLRDVAEAVSTADANALHGMRWRISDLGADLITYDPGDHEWPVYGALLVNLRNITGALDLVATVHPVSPTRVRHQILTSPDATGVLPGWWRPRSGPTDPSRASNS